MILENFNPNNTKIIRKSNIELLRIFAMLLIVGNHFAGHGVMFKWNPDVMYVVWGNGSIVNKIFCSMLSLGGEIGVAVFFMITGYFNFSNNKIRLQKFINEVIFYGVSLGIISVVFKLLDSSLVISYKTCILSIFTPVTGGIWWFVTAYFFLILLSPSINQFLSRLNRGGVLVIVALWILWYVLGKFALFPEIEKAVFFYVLGFFSLFYNKLMLLNCFD